jgi:diacylglycerol kinase (ATP)
MTQRQRMRVTLLHNKSAGSENHARADLKESLRRGGHSLVDAVSDVETLLVSLADQSCDLVVVAGGDGTVSRAACALADRNLPLAILPLGTANNTARSLGIEIEGDIDALIAGWAAGTYRTLDLATINEGDRLSAFSEAVGWGIFPKVIKKTDALPSPERREHTLERDRRAFTSVIERAKPHPYEIHVDGEHITGEYLLVEIVNIPYIGPQLQVSPDTDPSDGKFELVLAGEHDRDALLELATSGRIPSDTRLTTRPAERVTVRSEMRCFHRDGSVVESTNKPNISAVAIKPASVTYLLS